MCILRLMMMMCLLEVNEFFSTVFVQMRKRTDGISCFFLMKIIADSCDLISVSCLSR